MFFKNILTTGALLSLVAAVPLQNYEKRDMITVTKVQEDVVTIPVTKTIWVEPGQTVPAGSGAPVAPKQHHSHHNHHKQVTSHIRSTVTVMPSPPIASNSPAESQNSPPPPPPTTTSAPAAPPASSAPPAPASSQAPSGGAIQGVAAAGTSYVGDLTWYDTGLGACGWTSTASDHIVAISEDIFDVYGDVNPNDNPLCGRYVTITGANGSPYKAKIVDRCTGCAQGDLDLSEDFFNTVTNNGDGRVPGVHWQFD